jgi:hypothetical protein
VPRTNATLIVYFNQEASRFAFKWDDASSEMMHFKKASDTNIRAIGKRAICRFQTEWQ